MVKPLHPDAPAILTLLKREGISAFYHFTSVENLPGICEILALCSKKTQEEMKGLSATTGGNLLSHSLDQHRNNWDKVSLSFTPHLPMVYHRKREQHLCFLLIDPQVAAWSGAIFTDTNATRNDHKRRKGLEGLHLVNFSAIRAFPRPGDEEGWKRPVQAEVLIPDRIPIEFVTEIAFVSKASLQFAEHLCKQQNHPVFVVKEQPFADISMFVAGGWVIDFPHLLDLGLTDTKIDRNMINLPHKNIFSRSSGQDIILICQVKAKPGTCARIHWHPIDKKESVSFPGDKTYSFRCSIPVKELPAGPCSIELFLGDIRWSRIDFEIQER